MIKWQGNEVRDQIEIMEKEKIINLHVKLVSAIDPDTRMPHDAYTVYSTEEGTISLASSWTLRDAIALFRKLHRIDDQAKVCLVRPFRKQRTL